MSETATPKPVDVSEMEPGMLLYSEWEDLMEFSDGRIAGALAATPDVVLSGKKGDLYAVFTRVLWKQESTTVAHAIRVGEELRMFHSARECLSYELLSDVEYYRGKLARAAEIAKLIGIDLPPAGDGLT